MTERGFLETLYDTFLDDGYDTVADMIDRGGLWSKKGSSVKIKFKLRNYMLNNPDFPDKEAIIAALNSISYWQKTNRFNLEY